MRRFVPRVFDRLREEDGLSLIEVGVSAIVSLILAALMTTWLMAVGSANIHHDADDEVIQGLRTTRSHLTRELRGAEALTVAEPYEVQFWLDGDRDATADSGEMITWQITGSGVLTRSTDTGETADVLTGLVVPESGFTYDDSVAADVTFVSIDLAMVVTGRRDLGERAIHTEVELRNATLGGG
jgi:hypothetical protein